MTARSKNGRDKEIRKTLQVVTINGHEETKQRY